VQIEQSTRDGCTIITLTGHLDRAAAPNIQQLLLSRLREQPIAVICDLGVAPIWWTHERLRAASPRRSSRATYQTAVSSSVPR
jgi:hypothetical protein